MAASLIGFNWFFLCDGMWCLVRFELGNWRVNPGMHELKDGPLEFFSFSRHCALFAQLSSCVFGVYHWRSSSC